MSPHSDKKIKTVLPLVIMLGCVWTIIVAASLAWNIHKSKQEYNELARNEAIAMFNKDQGFRLWGTKHGGIYAPVSEETPPSPYLEHVDERDITTPSGKKLTLMNPAYMVRQLMEGYNELYGTRGHITGLILLRPENAPDEWEEKALHQFIDDGAKEVSEFTEIEGKPFLRLMRPMVMTKGCEKCHGHLGFRAGDVRGGVSVAVPMEHYNQRRDEQINVLSLTHGSVWMVGLFFVGFGGRHIHQSVKETLTAEAEVRALNRELEDRVAQRTDELREKEHRLHMTVEGAADGIIVIDEKGIIETFNISAQKIFGYSEEEAIGQNVSMLMPQEHSVHHDGYLAHHIRTGEENVIGSGREVEAIRKNGELFPLHLAVSKIVTKEQILFSGIIRDLSKEKMIEMDLKVAKLEAEQANRAKSEFLASMSHELRTPLNSIIGFSQLLDLDKKNALQEGQKQKVKHINIAGQHLLSLINDILDLSRIETEGFTLSLEAVDLKTVSTNCLDLIQPIARKNNLEIRDQLTSLDLPYIHADMVRLKQVLMNLLSNAVKYNTKDGFVQLGAQIKGHKIRILIEDSGKGIEQDKLQSLFEPFNRLGEEAGEIEGTGIGLTITKKLVEMMDGTIGVESDPGKGSCFWIELPISDHQPIASNNAQHTPDITISSLTSSDPLCLVYIEDNEANRLLLSHVLSDYDHIDLHLAETAEEGLKTVSQVEPDFIFMDINLPGMNGQEAMKILKADTSTSHIPVVALSANAMKHDKENAIASGFDGYLSKPLDISEVLLTISRLVKDKSSA